MYISFQCHSGFKSLLIRIMFDVTLRICWQRMRLDFHIHAATFFRLSKKKRWKVSWRMRDVQMHMGGRGRARHTYHNYVAYVGRYVSAAAFGVVGRTAAESVSSGSQPVVQQRRHAGMPRTTCVGRHGEMITSRLATAVENTTQRILTVLTFSI
jgi:hypothetical protein